MYTQAPNEVGRQPDRRQRRGSRAASLHTRVHPRAARQGVERGPGEEGPRAPLPEEGGCYTAQGWLGSTDDIWPLERPVRERSAYEMLFNCVEESGNVG